MHILVTADAVGGVWTYTRELVLGLLQHGHQVTLVSFGPAPSVSQTSWTKHERLAFCSTSFPLEWMQNADAGVRESVEFLEQLVLDRQPDLLHSNQFCYGRLKCAIPKVVVAHSDVLSWWEGVHGGTPPASQWLHGYKNLVSDGLQSCDTVVAPSQWMLHKMREHYGDSFDGRVIHNGRSTSGFTPTVPKSDYILSVGRIWDEAKQIRLLLSKNLRVPVKIAGSLQHPEHGSFFSYEQSESNFEFCGEQNEAELCSLYSNCAAYVATSRYEPFGLALVEAALSGCALILNDIPSFRELWGDAAFYFRRNDPESMAEAILTLSQNSSAREAFASRALQCANARFNASRMVSQYEELYRNLIERRTNA